LESNQLDILPPFGVREEIIEETKRNLDHYALPNNIAPIPVHVQLEEYDDFNPNRKCQNLGFWLHHNEHSDYVKVNLTEKHKEHVQAYAEQFGFDPANFTARDELDTSDPVHSHYYERRPNDLTEEFVADMMDLRKDYFLYGHCSQDWMPKLYDTGAFESIVANFKWTMNEEAEGRIYDADRRRFYFWSDHDTGMQNFACEMNYLFEIYIPFDTQFLW